jgi:hypothetical protein
MAPKHDIALREVFSPMGKLIVMTGPSLLPWRSGGSDFPRSLWTWMQFGMMIT